MKIKDHLKIGQKSPISPKWWIKKNENPIRKCK